MSQSDDELNIEKHVATQTRPYDGGYTIYTFTLRGKTALLYISRNNTDGSYSVTLIDSGQRIDSFDPPDLSSCVEYVCNFLHVREEEIYTKVAIT